MKKRTRGELVIIVVIVVVIASLLSMPMVSYALNKHNEKEIEDTLTKVYNGVDQKMALKQLNELRGRISEIKDLSYHDISRNVLMDELERIASEKLYTNKYLDDFAFSMPSTSDVGEICEELISQIDDQIHIIEYGAKGE